MKIFHHGLIDDTVSLQPATDFIERHIEGLYRQILLDIWDFWHHNRRIQIGVSCWISGSYSSDFIWKYERLCLHLHLKHAWYVFQPRLWTTQPVKHSWTVVLSSFHRFDSCFFLFELPRCFFSEPAQGAPQINHHQPNWGVLLVSLHHQSSPILPHTLTTNEVTIYLPMLFP